MPSIGNPFGSLSLNRKLSKEELIRAVRFMAAAEYEAIDMYTRIAEATDDEGIKKVILDIVDEEKVHVGEFIKALTLLDPEEIKLYEKGMEEAKENLNKKAALADALRSVAGKYVWKKVKKDKAKFKTLMYKSPFSGKKFHVSP